MEPSADDPIPSGDRRLNARVGEAGGSVGVWLIAASLSALPLANASPVADIQLAERVTVDASDLVLNGAGLRKKLLFRVYVVGFYLPERRQSPVDVFALSGPKRVLLLLLRALPARGSSIRSRSPSDATAHSSGIGR